MNSNGNQLEEIVRSGLFGALSPYEGKILVVLYAMPAPDVAQIMQHSGIFNVHAVMIALKHFEEIGLVEVVGGKYRLTFENQKFQELLEQQSAK